MPNLANLPSVAGYTVADLCERWRVGADKVHRFIRNGELEAVNLAASVAARPQWRITPEAVQRFEQRRGSQPTPKVNRRKRQPTKDFTADW